MYNYTPSSGSVLKVLIKQADTKLSYIIDKYNSDKWAKKLATRDQLEIMVSANLAQSRSLADIASMIEGTRRFSCSSINKSSLSRVNKHRDYRMFEELYQSLLKQVRKRVGYSNIRSIDTTLEVVSKILYALWKYDDAKGAVKIGLEYDPYWELPGQVVISDGKMADINHGRRILLQKGTTYLMDRGFRGYDFLTKIIKKQAYFVARVRVGSKFKKHIVNRAKGDLIISDEIGTLGDQTRIHHAIRLVKIQGKTEEIWLATNRFDLSAKQLAELYRKRWSIEVFTKTKI